MPGLASRASRAIMIIPGTFYVVNPILGLVDEIRAVKVIRIRLNDLSRQCDSLLSMVKDYSPRLIGTLAATEADAIERAVEQVLTRVSGWAKLGDFLAFLRQNEIQAGIEECQRELTTCSEKFNMALSMMNIIGRQMDDVTRQRDHNQLVDMMARFLNEVRERRSFTTSETPEMDEATLESQVRGVDSDGEQSAVPVVSLPRSRSANISGNVSEVSEQAAIEGSSLATPTLPSVHSQVSLLSFRSSDTTVACLARINGSSAVETDSASGLTELTALANESLNINEYPRQTPSSSSGNLRYSMRSVVSRSSISSISVTNQVALPARTLSAPPVPPHVVNGGDVPLAVASKRQSVDFHELFRTIPEGDNSIEDYGCALQRESLIQGRMNISENNICFYANNSDLASDVPLIIPLNEVVSLEKWMTSVVIPDAIRVTTQTTRYTFTSFPARDTAYDVIYNIWRLARPEDGLSRGENMGRPALNVLRTPYSVSLNRSVASISIKSVVAPIHKVTYCACGREDEHYSELAMDTDFPGTPERIYNLMFVSGFLEDFLSENQKLEDVQISDLAPVPGDKSCLARNVSYVRPLNGSIGLKSTKCEIRNETVHCDFDDFITTVTTTRTPDVPSGGMFDVKTRTCITWAGSASSRVVVTTQVEWTERSVLKWITDRSAIEGQRAYYKDLDRAMRVYIQEHQNDFVPAGAAGLDSGRMAVPELGALGLPATPTGGFPPVHQSGAAYKKKGKEKEQEGKQGDLQWTHDNFDGALSSPRRVGAGVLRVIHKSWDRTSTSTIIVFLILSHLWTYMLIFRREETVRRDEMRRTEERERWLQDTVTALWELSVGREPGSQANTAGSLSVALSGNLPHARQKAREVAELSRTPEVVEERMRFLLQNLAGLD